MRGHFTIDPQGSFEPRNWSRASGEPKNFGELDLKSFFLQNEILDFNLIIFRIITIFTCIFVLQSSTEAGIGQVDQVDGAVVG